MALPAPSATSTALVTGASSGIGEHIARELARRGHGVTLVARREERLRTLAEALSAEHGVRAEVVVADLADPEARDRLAERVDELGRDVDVLVNNAGFGVGGRFQEIPREDEVQQVRVLCEAVVDLCARYAPAMVERRRGAILNVASTAGMQPMPFSAGYAAAKAHALSFSEALHEELEPVGVTVTALCPGPVETEFFAKGHPSAAITGIAWEPVEKVARAGVRGLESGRRVVVPGLPMRTFMATSRYVPHALKLPAIARTLRRSMGAP